MYQKVVGGAWVLSTVLLAGCPLADLAGSVDTADAGEDTGADGDFGAEDNTAAGGAEASADGGVAEGTDGPPTSGDGATGLAQGVCETLRAEVEPSWEGWCTQLAIASSSDAFSCQAELEDCLATYSAEPVPDHNVACDAVHIEGSEEWCPQVAPEEIAACAVDVVLARTALTCEGFYAGQEWIPECVFAIGNLCPEALVRLPGEGPDAEGPYYPGDDYDDSHDGDLICEDAPPEQLALAAELDCEAFCAEVLAADCSTGPSATECMVMCSVAKGACSHEIARLEACKTGFGETWSCGEDGELGLGAGCWLEVECFGGCLDTLF